MRQFVYCNGCNHQVPTPESLEGKPSPQFLKCEDCGNEFFWNGGLTDNSEPLILFSIEDSVESLETLEDVEEAAEIELNQESTGQQSDESGSDDTNQIVDLEILEKDVEIADVELPQETPIEQAAEPLRLVIAENTVNENFEEQSETFESVEQSLESEPSLSDSLAPQEIAIVPQAELDPPTQLEPEPIVNENEPEPFELELEIESESDAQFSESETPQPPATENATENALENATEIAAGYEEEPFALGDPYLEREPNTEPNANTLASERAPVAELAVPLDSSPAVDWSVLGPTVPRRRPKEASAIRKILPPVLGGLAAFPIATLILWYGFGKDIGTTGPTVAKYVPWIVPEKFRSMPFDSSPPSFASGRTQPSSPSNRNKLPTLNRDETNVPPNDQSIASAPSIASKKPEVAPEKPATPAVPKANSENESSTSNISQTIEAIKALQKEMENSPPGDTKEGKKERARIFVACQLKLNELSKQASELSGPSARIWDKQIQAISRKVLADSVIPRVMGIIGNKAREEIKASVSGDFVATVLEIAEADSPLPNANWMVLEKWRSDDGGIPIEVLPGAWPTSSSSLPATCLAFGRLLPNEDSDANARDSGSTVSGLVLKVHLLVPK